MAYKKKILQLIEQAAKEGRTVLDLSNKQLTSLPPDEPRPHSYLEVVKM